MNELFAPAIPADKVFSDRFRVHPVEGDRMSPTLKPFRDYVLIAPVDHYEGEGIYLVFDGFTPQLYRVSSTLDRSRPLCLSGDNDRYQDHHFSAEQFNEHVLGIVVADIKVRDERHLRGVRQ